MGDMEDLLKETLQDFQLEDLPGDTRALVEGQHTASLASHESFSTSQGSCAASAPVLDGNTGALGGSTAGASNKKPLSFDPLRRSAANSRPTRAVHAEPVVSRHPSVSPQSQIQLPPEVQQLSEDLLKLVEEFGFGQPSSNNPGSDQGAESSSNPLVQELLQRAHQGQASNSVHSDPEQHSTSAVVQGLLSHTQRTVDKSAKAKGEAAAAAAATSSNSAQSSSIPGLGNLPFGDILGALGGAGGPGDGAVNLMVEHIMRNLLSKEVLYAPLKEISDKYPPWLEANQGKMPAEEFQRFVAQYESIQRVCRQYEEAPSDYGKLASLIQEMQTYGDPPSEIVDEVTGGLPPNIAEALNAEGEEHDDDMDFSKIDFSKIPELSNMSKDLDKCSVQ